MKVEPDVLKRMMSVVEGLRTDRLPFWSFWRELADYYLPQRYVYLQSPTERSKRTSRNQFILDGTGTMAARTLASGMMNGITSPSRPWIRLNIKGRREELPQAARIWLDEVTQRLMLVMAETNFYNSLAIMYLDLAVFGSAACYIYEDFEDVFRCYNSPLGEFYLGQSDRQAVNIVAREFSYKVRQVVEWFGEDNCSEGVREKWKKGGAQWNDDVDLVHLIEPNYDTPGRVAGNFEFRETYWEAKRPQTEGQVLARRGYRELPGIFPRWELTANDSYGTCPAMDALGDVIQLQHETKSKGQGLDKMISPPVIADIQLQHKPTALLPRGITYVAGVNNVGVKPAYTVQLPLNDLSMDIAQVQQRIKETFHNDLFRMISNLDTVRSATEIDARREEKLVLLGPVLERFENEALDPAIQRIYSIMERAGLIPEPPPEVAGAELEIQYVSVLTAAQTAVATIPIERWVGFIGNMAAVRPDVLNIPDWEETIRYYGTQLGVPAKLAVPRDQSEAASAQQAQQAQMAQQAATGGTLADAGKTLSETQVGGGASALSQLMGA